MNCSRSNFCFFLFNQNFFFSGGSHNNHPCVSPPDPRPEGRGPRRFFDFLGRELTFSMVWSGRSRRSVAEGWGTGTRERQHASRNTIPERWGERTHPRTEVRLSLNRSALATVRIQLPTLASGVGITNFTLDISVAATSLEATANSCQYCYPAWYSPVLTTASSCACMCVREWCSSTLHFPVHV